MTIDYKNTLNLPKTSFPMKANLAQREPKMLAAWQQSGLYQQLQQQNAAKPKFILNDGPPYANGNIHIGHAVNKILKDIINKSKLLGGFNVPFTPGWDCHGLPIELKVEEKVGKPGVKIDNQAFRAKCREYASKQVAMQRTSFERLGILADWDKPYLTMDYKFEANIIRSLAKIISNGHLVKGSKPVHWCTNCSSALAEAEVEYMDKTSPAIDVRYKICTKDFDASIVIWTTTPWTLPASEAVAVHKDIEYALVQLTNENILVAKELVANICAKLEISDYKIIKTYLGSELENIKVQHPFYDKQLPIVLGEHVTLDAGTGCVHTAPAHGLDDYLVGKKYNLPIHNPVAANGCFLEDTQLVAGLHVFKSNEKVLEILQQHNALLHSTTLKHSYPHCWRHKKPLIFRATPQWFIGMDFNGLRAKALTVIKDVAWYPAWGEQRMEKMVEGRPDWCISRQRTWGVPMALILHKDTGELHPNAAEFLETVAKKVAIGGIDAWFNMDLAELLGEDASNYVKSVDTLDVWFDSGVVHSCVLDNYNNLHSPADLYLEGSDQYRGWFNSSLFTSLAMQGVAPYKQVLTHGFVVDANGRKMSKSLGNVVEPEKITKTLGADVLRLWAASVDYTKEMHVSEEILKRSSDTYRRIRNTMRFLLANLHDFDPASNLVATDKLLELDLWIINYTNTMQDEIIAAYNSYNFHAIYQKIHNFCVLELGGFYLDIIKDRQYTCSANGVPRRSAQTAMYYVAQAMVRWLAPILSFTSEEIWQHLPGGSNRTESVFSSSWYEFPIIKTNKFSGDFWQDVINAREVVNKSLEDARNNNLIGSPLEAKVIVKCHKDLYAKLLQLGVELKFIFIVSEVLLETIDSDSDNISVVVTKSSHDKCARCWHRAPVQDSICKRCVSNLTEPGETRYYA
ncbi:MAG: isoleucine--tRNA ligase [Legionellales bacterium]|nr:MAG: isoleucine--tRNA ligase [Legionellales bacterium]